MGSSLLAGPAIAAPIHVPCPTFPDMQDPTYRPIAYLCGMEVLAEDMWIHESFEAYDATLRTRRNNYIAVYLQAADNGYLIMDNVDILLGGHGNTAIAFNSLNRRGAQLDNVRIGLAGDDMTGISSSVAIPDANGELVPVSTFAVRDSAIDIVGDRGIGWATGMHHRVDAERMHIQVQGEQARALAQWAGDVRLRDSTLQASGTNARALHLISQRLSWPGKPSYGYTPYLLLEQSTVRADGEGSTGLHAEYTRNQHDGMGASVELVESTITATGGDAVRFAGGRANQLRQRGGALQGRDAGVHLATPGSALQAWLNAARISSSAGSALQLDDQTRLDLVATNGSVLAGADGGAVITLGDQAQASLDLTGSTLRGGVARGLDAYLEVALRGGSHWQMGGGGTLDQLQLRDSTLSLADGRAGDRLHVLGDLVLDNGHLVLDSQLDGDDAATDHVRVEGSFRGRGTLAVHNAGGRGAQTGKGIEVIGVGGVSDADLTLDGRAVGGLYEYFLHHDDDDGGWYLRSALLPEDPCDRDPSSCAPDESGGDDDGRLPGESGEPVVDPVVDPIVDPEGDRGGDPRPFVARPEVGSYLANQQAVVQLMAPAMRATRRPLDAGTDRVHAWAALDSGNTRQRAVAAQLALHTQRNRLQVGADTGVFAQGRGRVGLQLSTGTATTQSASAITGYAAAGQVRGAALGVDVGWTTASGKGYVDAVVQRGRYRHWVQGAGLARETRRSRAWQGGVEAGYRMALGRTGAMAWSLQPQVAVLHRDLRDTALVERNGTRVATQGNDGLGTRLGLRLEGRGHARAGAQVSPYAGVAWQHEGARGAMVFDDVAVAAALPRDRFEGSAGARVDFRSGLSAWGGLATGRGSGHYREARAELGMSYSW